MTRVLHVIDRSCDETQAQMLESLRARLNGEDQRHTVCSIDPIATTRAASHLRDPIVQAYGRSGRSHSAELYHRARFCHSEEPRASARAAGRIPLCPKIANGHIVTLGKSTRAELIHAWGIRAAAIGSTRLPDLPMLITLLDPETATDAAHWIRSFSKPITVAAGSQVIRSRLVTAGVPPDQIAVIRGPVDFGAINRARENETRRQIVGDAAPVILLGGPPTRDGGQFSGLWAAAIVRELYPELTVLMPYDSHESARLNRFARAIADPSFLTVPDSRLSWAELAACADVFLMPAEGEVCIEPLGTAMAAGCVVVGTAVRSIAEIIADGSNGLLCKAAEPKALAGRILTAIEDTSLRRKLTDAARSQAFEIFSTRSFVDNYSSLYENLVAGKPPGDDIRDTALVA